MTEGQRPIPPAGTARHPGCAVDSTGTAATAIPAWRRGPNPPFSQWDPAIRRMVRRGDLAWTPIRRTPWVRYAPGVHARMAERGLAAALVSVVLLLTVFQNPQLQVAIANDARDPLAIMPLLALVVLSLITLITRPRAARYYSGATALFGLAVLLTISFAVHPVAEGGQLLLVGLWGAWAIAYSIPRLPSSGLQLIGVTLTVVGCAEALIAILERVAGRSVGLYWLGEDPRPFSPGPEGTLIHSYVLTALALVVVAVICADTIGANSAIFPSRWFVLAAGLAAVPIGLTTSRAGVLGMLFLCCSLAVAARAPSHRTRALSLLGAIVLGVGLATLISSAAWTARVTDPAQLSDETSGRLPLIKQGAHLLLSNSVIGVGPGRYAIALERPSASASSAPRTDPLPVHDVPLLAGAEGGFGALAICVVLLVVLARRAWARGPVTVGMYFAILPYFLLDKLLYSLIQGAVVLGFWVGFLDFFSTLRTHPGPATTEQLGTADSSQGAPSAV